MKNIREIPIGSSSFQRLNPALFKREPPATPTKPPAKPPARIQPVKSDGKTKRRARLNPSKLESRFVRLWKALEGQPLHEEFKFHPIRRWRFDFAHPSSMVAIEVEGGVFSGGRHTRGYGFTGDCIKYFHAASLGWLVFRLTSDMITVAYLEKIITSIKIRLVS